MESSVNVFNQCCDEFISEVPTVWFQVRLLINDCSWWYILWYFHVNGRKYVTKFSPLCKSKLMQGRIVLWSHVYCPSESMIHIQFKFSLCRIHPLSSFTRIGAYTLYSNNNVPNISPYALHAWLRGNNCVCRYVWRNTIMKWQTVLLWTNNESETRHSTVFNWVNYYLYIADTSLGRGFIPT